MGAVETLNDPGTTAARRDRLRRGGYLRRLYSHWYRLLLREIPNVPGEVLELGSGGGFFEEFLPGLRTSDVMHVPGVELVVDARSLPFPDGSLRAIVGTNVLHHVPDIERFLGEAQRTLTEGGRLVFIEPWPTALSRPIYRHLHHEPFDEVLGFDPSFSQGNQHIVWDFAPPPGGGPSRPLPELFNGRMFASHHDMLGGEEFTGPSAKGIKNRRRP